MPNQFLYDAISSARTDSMRNWLAPCGVDQETAVGYFFLNETTGLQAITGIGFQPELVGIIGVALAPDDEALPGWEARASAFHIGFADGTDQWAGSLAGGYNYFTWGAARHSYWRNDRVLTMQGFTGFVNVESFAASLDSFDADGFTLDVDVAPTKGVRCVYFAARGAPNGYKVGTTQIPVVTGNQAVYGVGFQPSAVFVANGPGGLGVQDHEWIGVGAADGTDQFSTWAGARKGAPFLSMRNDTGKCVTFAESSSGSGGAGRVIRAQASLVSMESDGFLLNWSAVDGTRYFHWVAFGGESDVGRFLFDPAANDEPVTTTGEPRGLIGFGNDQPISEENNWEATRNAASLGVSFCGTDVANEYSASFHEGYPQTLSITANRRSIRPGSCGAYSNNSSINGVHRNLVDIVLLQGMPRIAGMNWRYAQRHGVATRALHNVSDITP